MKQLEPSMMPFTRLMGLEVTTQEKARIVGRISVREELCTTGKIMLGFRIQAGVDRYSGTALKQQFKEV